MLGGRGIPCIEPLTLRARLPQLLGPVARRKPGVVIPVAVVAGILLAYGRPWRWLLRSPTLVGAITQIGRAAVRGPSAKAWRTEFKQGVFPSKKAQAA